MDAGTFATKGNLIAAKNTLRLSKLGFDLLDRKRNILIRELMSLVDEAAGLQSEINKTFEDAFAALRGAAIDMGIDKVDSMSRAVPIENGVNLRIRSVMGVEIPKVSIDEEDNSPPFGMYSMTTSLDEVHRHFKKVKMMSLRLAEVETAAYRLAVSVRKTQKRANALKNIMIPRYENLVADITNSLEEKEREEFTRLKVIKTQKNKEE